MATTATLFVLFAFIVFATRRLLRYLHIFQQEEYDAKRYFSWIFEALAVDKKVSAAVLLLGFAAWEMGIGGTVLATMLAITFLAAAFFEPDPQRDAKKKLVLTPRATRQLGVSFIILFLIACLVVWSTLNILWIAAVQAIPFVVALTNWSLQPVERRIQDGFRTRAVERLAEVNPTIIAITGSFGKTSVKHILGHVLQMTTNALYTPGSVNTVMGISRVINEQLDPNCRYFIVEMGAYGTGSIERLCQFTPPHHGILTSIGAAHYERFKDLETVAKAKFELATAVAKANGTMVIDTTVLERQYAKQRVDAAPEKFLLVGEGADVDIEIRQIEQTKEGLKVDIADGGITHRLFAPLYGIHHGRNMALAYGLARVINIAPDRIIAALRTTPQIKHRLEVKPQSSGVTYLDDAYNSNPEGFANALDLMQILNTDHGRRILITPGMAELGEKHDSAHREIGIKAANSTDIVALIQPERIPTFTEGFHDAGGTARLETFETFSEARSWLDQTAKPGDIVLVENDLPDLYERDFPT